jgi:hypothetical protein
MRYYHVTYASVRRLVLFPDEAARRAGVRCIDRIAGDRTVLFSGVDDQLHDVLVCLPERIGVVAGAVLRALRCVVPVELEPPHIRPVENRRHLTWLVEYCAKQTGKHGIHVDGALWTGSCFQDIVGARRLPRYSPELLREALPRLHANEVLRMLGMEPADLRCSDDLLRHEGAARIVAAAAASLAVGPLLIGRGSAVAEARAAAVHLATAAGIPRSEIGWATELTRQRIGQILRTTVDPATLAAARRRLALENAVRARRGAAA